MSDFIGRVLGKLGRRFAAPRRKPVFATFPGSILVGGKRVTELKPLGGYHRPGITKAGRLSFSGFCEGRKVKVYSTFSEAQAALRLAVQRQRFVGCSFPEIVAADAHLVAETWVEGRPLSDLDQTGRDRAAESVTAFLQGNRNDPALIELARAHRGAFCYFEDYLLPRLGVWIYWDEVGAFVERWRRNFAILRPVLPEYLSHPDLSLANLISEQDTGRLVIVDNELLGVGAGWLLDWQNSLLGKPDSFTAQFDEAQSAFIANSWRLRRLGSALDANDFVKAHEIIRQENATTSNPVT